MSAMTVTRHLVAVIAMSLMATGALAENLSGPFLNDLNTAKRGVDGMLAKAQQLKLGQRRDAKEKVGELMEKLGAVMMALDTVNIVGRDGWFRFEGESCVDVCGAMGLANDASPEGAMCVSGEVRPESAIGIIQFTKGCWGVCTAQSPAAVAGAMSVGQNCYKPGQKRDNDRTDQTVGCFCQ